MEYLAKYGTKPDHMTMQKNQSTNLTSSYELVCGMEVHAELKTKSKMFCGCKNDPFHAPKPNVYTCPVCLGMPGGLPVANRTAIEWTIQLGLALGCEINLFSHFDRKNYFYPDLPKGYQISQYDQPFCVNGQIETEEGTVRIRRIHLEEDTGKLIHRTLQGRKVSLIDFNRSSVPLVEIVTEPDIKSAEQAKAYGKALRQILRYLDIADCDMEQGGMRLEANISVRPNGITALPPFKVELKNINSFRFMEKAIAYEVERQTELVKNGETPIQETRGWSEERNQTFSQRVKEDAEDYRYFPDPDLPPLRFTPEQIAEWRQKLPELPAQLQTRWSSSFGIESKYAEVLSEDRETAQWCEQVFAAAHKVKIDVNKLANAMANKKLNYTVTDKPEKIIANFLATSQTEAIDADVLNALIKEVLSAHPDAITKYQQGNAQVIGFFIGQLRKKITQKVDPQQLVKALEKALAST
jgi:aspartyl-tRNA(Asn)/glutamyl-tRNA(Gln) amidotransferase subunit B